MFKFIQKRLIWLIPVVLGVSILIFTILSFTPGDPAQTLLGPMASEQLLTETRAQLGLDKPFVVQYFVFIKNIVLHGDFGSSYQNQVSVTQEVLNRAPYTLRIAFISVFLSIIFGLPLGVIAATNQYTWKDNASIFASIFFVSVPQFWMALQLVLFFSLKLGWLPSMGVDSWKSYILPCAALCLNGVANIARQTRSSMLEVIRQDYITTARAKGLSERVVITKHALKNAVIPIIMTVGNMTAMMLGGSLIVETIFAIPGMGIYIVNAIQSRDYPIIRGAAIVISIWFCLIMLLVDIVFAIADPRIRSQFAKRDGN